MYFIHIHTHIWKKIRRYICSNSNGSDCQGVRLCAFFFFFLIMSYIASGFFVGFFWQALHFYNKKKSHFHCKNFMCLKIY